MPGLEGDLDEWQTQEVNDIDLEGLPILKVTRGPRHYLFCYYSCVFGKRNHRVLVRVSVCVCVCVSVCVCVFLHDNSKRNRSRNTKSEYIVVYENSSDEFDIELHRIKVKVTVGVQKFSPFTTIQTVRSYSSTLVQARNLILSIYLHLILIYKIYECRHA